MRNFVLFSLLITELSATMYLALVVWLMSVWMVDDTRAVAMTTIDWYKAGLVRLGVFAIVSCLVGLATYFLNGLIAREYLNSRPRFRLIFSAILAFAILFAGCVGSVQFVVMKPYM